MIEKFYSYFDSAGKAVLLIAVALAILFIFTKVSKVGKSKPKSNSNPAGEP